jgi:hypothetical protein
MKYLGRSSSMTLVAILMVGCGSGSGTSGGDKTPPKEEQMMPPKADSLNRNPGFPLTCDRPLVENADASQLQRLTNTQYVNTLKTLFSGMVPDGAIPQYKDLPDELKEGSTFSNNALSQLGSDAATQTRESAAITITAEAVKDLGKFMGCQAKDAAAEGGCVDSFIDSFGGRAWRRPLGNDEKSALKALFTEARKTMDFAPSVQTMTGAMLQAPQFLYRIQEGTGDVVAGLGKRLSDYEIASNLSYTIWNSMPDSELFDLAKKGELSTVAQIEKQAQRMLDAPAARDTMLKFQREWLHADRLETLADANTKDKTLFPDYTLAQSSASMKGFEAFLQDAFWEGDHSLKQIFTSSKGFVNDDSAALFGAKKPGSKDLVKVDLNDSERKGILTQPFVMAGWANDKWQSAILRGAFIMEGILCAPSPPPPPGVVAKLKDVPQRNAVTQRQVVEMTVEQGSCAGCHKTIDGYGFLFDNYNAVGAYTDKERDLPLNTSANIDEGFDTKAKFDNGVKFSEALATSPQAAQCFVQNMYEFVTARPPVEEDGCQIAPLTDSFLADGTDMKKLMLNVIKSPAFRYRSAAK